jgi:hypothetical protein
MNRMVMTVAVVCAACHYHRDTNAPGLVDVHVPPRDITKQELEYPGDPGEQMITLSTGILAGGGGGPKAAPNGVGDFALEATLDWGTRDYSHNDNAKDYFMPTSAQWPQQGYGVTLGWSALRLLGAGEGEPPHAAVGPVYAELQKFDAIWGLGAGFAVQPTDGHFGPQVNAWLGGVFLRTRYLFDAGFELHFGVQLKWPTTWVWSR